MPDRPDASQDQASAGTKEPSTETVTMTVAELEARDTKTASDALAGAGRTAADLKTREDALAARQEAHQAEAAESRKRQHASEDVAAADDPNLLANR